MMSARNRHRACPVPDSPAACRPHCYRYYIFVYSTSVYYCIVLSRLAAIALIDLTCTMTTHVPRPFYSQEELDRLYPKELELQLVQIV
jgi:hypothetical protein